MILKNFLITLPKQKWKKASLLTARKLEYGKCSFQTETLKARSTIPKIARKDMRKCITITANFRKKDCGKTTDGWVTTNRIMITDKYFTISNITTVENVKGNNNISTIAGKR